MAEMEDQHKENEKKMRKLLADTMDLCEKFKKDCEKLKSENEMLHKKSVRFLKSQYYLINMSGVIYWIS